MYHHTQAEWIGYTISYHHLSLYPYETPIVYGYTGIFSDTWRKKVCFISRESWPRQWRHHFLELGPVFSDNDSKLVLMQINLNEIFKNLAMYIYTYI